MKRVSLTILALACVVVLNGKVHVQETPPAAVITQTGMAEPRNDDGFP